MREAVAPLLGFIGAAALFWHTRGLDQVVSGGQLGPGFWPRLVLIGLGLACLAKLWRAVAAPTGPGRVVTPGIAPGEETRPAVSGVQLAAAIAAILLYVLAAPVLGFPLATVAFIGAFLWLCGMRAPWAIAANALLGTVGLLYLFVKLVYLPLPKGDGPLEGLTLAVYRALRIF